MEKLDLSEIARKTAAAEARLKEAEAGFHAQIAAITASGTCPRSERAERCRGAVELTVQVGGETVTRRVPCPLDGGRCHYREARLRDENSSSLRAMGFAEEACDPHPQRVPKDVRKSLSIYTQHIGTLAGKGFGYILVGGVGAGKTCALALTALAAVRATPRVAVARVAAADLFDIFHEAGNADPDAQCELNDLVRVKLLLLDDLGTEYMSGLGLSRWNKFVDLRWAARTTATCITTNLADYEQAEGERVWSRLRHRSPVLVTREGDKRTAATVEDWRKAIEDQRSE